MKRAEKFHRAINEFLNPEAVEHEKSSHFNRIDSIGAGKRMTQTNPRKQEEPLSEGEE